MIEKTARFVGRLAVRLFVLISLASIPINILAVVL